MLLLLSLSSLLLLLLLSVVVVLCVWRFAWMVVLCLLFACLFVDSVACSFAGVFICVW